VYGSRGLQTVLLTYGPSGGVDSTRAALDDVRKYWVEGTHKISFPIGLVPTVMDPVIMWTVTGLMQKFGLVWYPTYFVVDGTGKVRYIHMSHDNLEQAMDKLVPKLLAETVSTR
jgi:hypothetical protein